MADKRIMIEGTRFIFQTNFSGDSTQDRYGSSARQGNLIIPSPAQAEELLAQGFNVRQTRPHDDDEGFEPTYFVKVQVKYTNRMGDPVKYPPAVYLVSDDGEPVKMTEDSIGNLDHMRIKNVDAVLNSYEYAEGKYSLFVRTMYVTQDIDDDPYAARYARRARMAQVEDEDMPF